jgi:hypothetical protein
MSPIKQGVMNSTQSRGPLVPQADTKVSGCTSDPSSRMHENVGVSLGTGTGNKTGKRVCRTNMGKLMVLLAGMTLLSLSFTWNDGIGETQIKSGRRLLSAKKANFNVDEEVVAFTNLTYCSKDKTKQNYPINVKIITVKSYDDCFGILKYRYRVEVIDGTWTTANKDNFQKDPLVSVKVWVQENRMHKPFEIGVNVAVSSYAKNQKGEGPIEDINYKHGKYKVIGKEWKHGCLKKSNNAALTKRLSKSSIDFTKNFNVMAKQITQILPDIEEEEPELDDHWTLETKKHTENDAKGPRNWYLGFYSMEWRSNAKSLYETEYKKQMGEDCFIKTIHAYRGDEMCIDGLPTCGFPLMIYWINRFINMVNARESGDNCTLFFQLDAHGGQSGGLSHELRPDVQIVDGWKLDHKRMSKRKLWELLQKIPPSQVAVCWNSCFGIGKFGETLFPHTTQVKKLENVANEQICFRFRGKTGITCDRKGNISEVQSGSRAEKRGVRKGWVIKKINNHNYDDNGQYIRRGECCTAKTDLWRYQKEISFFYITFDTTRTKNCFKSSSSVPYEVILDKYYENQDKAYVLFSHDTGNIAVRLPGVAVQNQPREVKATSIERVTSFRVVTKWDKPKQVRGSFSCNMLVVAPCGINTVGKVFQNKSYESESSANWKKVKSKGEIYYFNTKTNEAQWDCPSGYKDSGEDLAEPVFAQTVDAQQTEPSVGQMMLYNATNHNIASMMLTNGIGSAKHEQPDENHLPAATVYSNDKDLPSLQNSNIWQYLKRTL